MKKFDLILLAFCFAFIVWMPSAVKSQQSYERDTLLAAARNIMQETTYCGFVTIDASGQPQVRTMNPFPPNNELVTWFATSRNSRKVNEIKNNPKVAVYYASHTSAIGYVNISGTAEIIDDKELLIKMKRDYWEHIPDWQNVFVLIKIVPQRLEVVNYRMGIQNAPETSKAPWVDF